MSGAVVHPHPYVPQDLQLPGYVPVVLSQSTIFGVYGAASFLVVAFVWIASGCCSKITKVDRILMCWWAFTGLTHIVIEGYFVFSPDFYKKDTPLYFAEVWKEYSKGDSRYAARDAGVVSVEGITAVLEGPASLLAVKVRIYEYGYHAMSSSYSEAMDANQKITNLLLESWLYLYAIAAKKSYSYILQFSVCLGQLYGVLVYYITALLEGDNFASTAFYYWAYYVVANSFWILIPILIARRCWRKITAVQVHQKSKRI